MSNSRMSATWSSMVASIVGLASGCSGWWKGKRGSMVQTSRCVSMTRRPFLLCALRAAAVWPRKVRRLMAIRRKLYQRSDHYVHADRIVIGERHGAAFAHFVHDHGMLRAQAPGGEPVELDGAVPAVVAQRPADEGEAPGGHPVSQGLAGFHVVHGIPAGVLAQAVRALVIEAAFLQQAKQPALELAFGMQVMFFD